MDSLHGAVQPVSLILVSTNQSHPPLRLCKGRTCGQHTSHYPIGTIGVVIMSDTSNAGLEPVNRPLPSLLTSREYTRVTKVTGQRITPNPDMTKAEYLAELWVTARELYPNKVS